MKKLFTLAFGALASLGAAAINPSAGFAKSESNLTPAATPLTAAINVQGSVTSRADGPDIEGTYIFMVNGNTEPYCLSVPTFEHKEGNAYTVRNFYDQTTFDVTLEYVENGPEENPFWALVVQPHTVAAVMNGIDQKIMPYKMSEDGGGQVYPNSEFYLAGVNIATGQLYWPYIDTMLFLGYKNEQTGYYEGFTLNPISFEPTNGTMSYTQYVNGNDNPSDVSDTPLFAYVQDNDISIFNFAEYMNRVTFTVNGDEAIATRQVINYYVKDDQFLDIIAAQFLEDGSYTDRVTAQYSKDDDGVITLTIPGTWYAHSASETDVWFKKYENTVITLFKEDDPQGGIDGINADNTDAPIEYFNLQGVRIDSPAAGQIVIRRQGSDVAKIIVR